MDKQRTPIQQKFHALMIEIFWSRLFRSIREPILEDFYEQGRRDMLHYFIESKKTKK